MIDADDLALLGSSFEAAMLQSPSAGGADAALHELGWGDLVAASPLQGAAITFALLGATGSAACLLDDVLANALGLPVAPDTCVVLPPPHGAQPAGVRVGDIIHIDGLVSARIDSVARVVVPVSASGACVFVAIDSDLLRGVGGETLDPDRPYRRVAAVEVAAADATPVAVTGSWDTAVRDARAALAHQLVAVSRRMLGEARQHAVDRVQFGRAIGSFQAVRHKLAETLVAIEGAAGVAGACTDGCDPLTAALAKSLASKAARLTAANAQQVLAGIGFTTDHTFHLSLKRAMVLDTLFGSARTLPTEIGLALLARANAPRLIEL